MSTKNHWEKQQNGGSVHAKHPTHQARKLKLQPLDVASRLVQPEPGETKFWMKNCRIECWNDTSGPWSTLLVPHPAGSVIFAQRKKRKNPTFFPQLSCIDRYLKFAKKKNMPKQTRSRQGCQIWDGPHNPCDGPTVFFAPAIGPTCQNSTPECPTLQGVNFPRRFPQLNHTIIYPYRCVARCANRSNKVCGRFQSKPVVFFRLAGGWRYQMFRM